MRSELFLRMAAGLALLAGCSDTTSYGNGGGGGCTPTATQICMLNTLFNPTSKKNVSAATSLTWKNGDPFGHTTTSNTTNPAGCPVWDHTVGVGQTSAAVPFPTAGVTCEYYCRIHATPTTGAMRGSITVQ